MRVAESRLGCRLRGRWRLGQARVELRPVGGDGCLGSAEAEPVVAHRQVQRVLHPVLLVRTGSPLWPQVARRVRPSSRACRSARRSQPRTRRPGCSGGRGGDRERGSAGRRPGCSRRPERRRQARRRMLLWRSSSCLRAHARPGGALAASEGQREAVRGEIDFPHASPRRERGVSRTEHGVLPRRTLGRVRARAGKHRVRLDALSEKSPSATG